MIILDHWKRDLNHTFQKQKCKHSIGLFVDGTNHDTVNILIIHQF